MLEANQSSQGSSSASGINALPAHCKPLLTVSGVNGERWALGVNEGGFIVTLWNPSYMEQWFFMDKMPPMLAAHMDTFLAQNYNLLNNQYGLPQKGAFTGEKENGDSIAY